MHYILASHGGYAVATVSSCEMIAGSLKNMHPIIFQDPMSLQDLVAEYQRVFEQINDPEHTVIITDIRSGTPANAAVLFKDQHPSVRIFTGLSLSLLLALALGTPVEQAFEENRTLMGEIVTEATAASPAAGQKNTAVQNTAESAIPEADAPAIRNIRIDERLIHGQVATMWTNKLHITRIMVVDDDIVASSVQKTTLKTAAPNGVHLSILTVDGAARRIKAGQYRGQNVFLIVRNPTVLMKLAELGVPLDQINVGNMSMKTDAVQIAKSVAVTQTDIAAFRYLDQHGSHLYHQMVPNDKPVPFMPLLSEKGEKS